MSSEKSQVSKDEQLKHYAENTKLLLQENADLKQKVADLEDVLGRICTATNLNVSDFYPKKT